MHIQFQHPSKRKVSLATLISIPSLRSLSPFFMDPAVRIIITVPENVKGSEQPAGPPRCSSNIFCIKLLASSPRERKDDPSLRRGSRKVFLAIHCDTEQTRAAREEKSVVTRPVVGRPLLFSFFSHDILPFFAACCSEGRRMRRLSSPRAVRWLAG